MRKKRLCIRRPIGRAARERVARQVFHAWCYFATNEVPDGDVDTGCLAPPISFPAPDSFTHSSLLPQRTDPLRPYSAPPALASPLGRRRVPNNCARPRGAGVSEGKWERAWCFDSLPSSHRVDCACDLWVSGTRPRPFNYPGTLQLPPLQKRGIGPCRQRYPTRRAVRMASELGFDFRNLLPPSDEAVLEEQRARLKSKKHGSELEGQNSRAVIVAYRDGVFTFPSVCSCRVLLAQQRRRASLQAE
jgi:hypothetical protein